MAGPGYGGALLDSDRDGLADLVEQRLGLDPYQPDSNHDGLSDSYELVYAGAPPAALTATDPGRYDTLITQLLQSSGGLTADPYAGTPDAWVTLPPVGDSGAPATAGDSAAGHLHGLALPAGDDPGSADDWSAGGAHPAEYGVSLAGPLGTGGSGPGQGDHQGDQGHPDHGHTDQGHTDHGAGHDPAGHDGHGG